MIKENKNPKKFSIQFILIMLLFLIIVMLSVMIIALGKNIYDKINIEREVNYELRVSLSYIANKLRQADKEGAVSIQKFNGNNAVVIKEKYDDMIYENWIYFYDNYLYEILVDEGISFNLSDGMKILKVDSFDITRVKEKLYKFSVKSNDISEELLLSLYSNQ